MKWTSQTVSGTAINKSDSIPPSTGMESAATKALADRAQWMEQALEAMRQSFEEDRFSDALGQFRQALNLSRGVPDLAVIAGQAALRQSERLLPANWRIAEVLLQEIAAVHADFAPQSDMQFKLDNARSEEKLTLAIHKADRSLLAGRKEEARSALLELQTAHPQDSRIPDRLQALDRPEPEAATSPFLVRMPAPARMPVPFESSLDTEETPNDFVVPLPRLWSSKIVIPHRTWDAAKSGIALAGSTAMLIAASVLVWQHLQKAPRPPLPVTHQATIEKSSARPDPVVEKIVPEDEQAWNLVRSSQNAKAIRDFLMAYPTSSHVLRAKIKLASLAWEHTDKSSASALDHYLLSYPVSPYRKEAEQMKLLALSKTVSQEDRDSILGVIRSFDDDHAGEYDEPMISGDEATVRFHPADGTNSQTFTLVRQDGSWKVHSVR